jgi:hypothetical protein
MDLGLCDWLRNSSLLRTTPLLRYSGKRSNAGEPRSEAVARNGGLNPVYQIGGPRAAQLALKLVF